MTKKSVIHFFLQLLGVIGYFAAVLLWLWVLTLWMPTVLDSSVVNTFTEKSAPAQQSPSYGFQMPSLASVGIAVVVTVASILLTVYIALKLPMAIVKRSSTVLHSSSQVLVPKTIHHKKVSKKKRLALSAHIIIALKIFASLIPLLGVYAVTLHGSELSAEIMWAVTLFLSAIALTSFCVQLIVSRCAGVEFTSVW